MPFDYGSADGRSPKGSFRHYKDSSKRAKSRRLKKEGKKTIDEQFTSQWEMFGIFSKHDSE